MYFLKIFLRWIFKALFSGKPDSPMAFFWIFLAKKFYFTTVKPQVDLLFLILLVEIGETKKTFRN